MDILVIFVITIILITLLNIKFSMPPFFTLIAGALCFGLLSGIETNLLMHQIVTGIATVFGDFGIIVICGIMISKLLIEQHYMDEIIATLRSLVRRPSVAAGLSGYMITLAATCSVAGYMMVQPFVAEFESDGVKRKALMYLVAICGAISYVMVFPSPVVLALLQNLSGGVQTFSFISYALPVSLLLLILMIAVISATHYRFDRPDQALPLLRPTFHLAAWTPILVIVASVPVVFFVFHLRSVTGIKLVMVIGALTALAVASPGVRTESFTKAARLSGLVIFDTCAAGGLGYVIINTPLAERAFEVLGPIVPTLIFPFLFAATIQAAQGSRIVTAVVSGQVLAGSAFQTALHPIPLMLMVAAGSCLFSYVTDPQFWLLQKTTGDDVRAVTRHYTIPLAMIGVLLLAIAAGLQVFVFS